MPPVQLIVFDLAGTTVEDDNAVAGSLHQAAAEAGLDVPLLEFQQSIGTNKIRLYEYLIARSRGRALRFEDLERLGLSEYHEEALRMFERYTVIMLDHYRRQVRAIPGAEEVFRWCKSQGIKVATDTGFHRDINTAIQEGLGWLERGLTDLAVDVEHAGGIGRPAPFMIFYAMQQLGVQSVHQVIKIGDTPADLLSGRNAGCRGNIAVLSGANSAEILGAYAHTHMLPSVRELPALILREFA
ncbi:MAG: HAD hydrolase-like protein [Bacteroidia bacterium]|nr:HAD hydrolase-like protein [Bacteroidia bacterium]